MPLPPIRQVAGDWGINLNTIAVADRQLLEEGLVSVRHSRVTEASELLKPVRGSLTELLLAGWSDREIAAAVWQERVSLHRKGDYL
jgi:DNA-binding transcriptional regulator YhcF (GntR family)